MTDNTRRRCDIFCTIVDNLGDIGVCWRLARQLSKDHQWQVRLWLDDFKPLAQLVPDADPASLSQQLDQVEVCRWEADFPQVKPADIVIEAFACELPETYLNAMAAQEVKPIWLNLEYLSVEDWAADCHCLPSPHPRLPLTKYFFFPGIFPGTGGVLCEHNLNDRRSGFDKTRVRASIAPGTDALWVSLFCYDNPVLSPLLSTWANGTRPITCVVAAGKPADQVAVWLGQTFNEGMTIQRGQLHLHALPFVAQERYDELLWTCDLNFVRGEDSFVRAQLAALPFIWQAYPQAENAHHAKLAAFIGRYATGLTEHPAAALRSFSAMWNGMVPSKQATVAAAWAELMPALPALVLHAHTWQKELAALGDLAENLAKFCEKR